MSAVYQLTTRTPHEDDDERMTMIERDAYTRGYYRALVAALRSMELALVKRALWLRSRRQAAARRAAERRASGNESRVRGGEQLRPALDNVAEGVRYLGCT